MSISNLAYIGFEVSDLDTWNGFMEDFVGLKKGNGNDAWSQFRMDNYEWRIACEKGPKDDISFVGLEVATREAFNDLKKVLSKKNVQFSQGDKALKEKRGVQDLVVLTDPAGLTVEIFYGATQVTQTPFVSPAGVSSFLTGEQGVGHIVLASNKMEEVRAFWVDVLGFKLSDTIGVELGPDFTLMLEFYHCNPRHHTLALTALAAPKRIHHFMVEMATLDDVGYAQDRLDSCDVKQTLTLGKHSNDEMVSFYVSTPSGFDLEIGCAGIPVHDEDWRVSHHKVTSMWGHKPVA
ncbi:MAG: VOC family protein [Parvibaculaceae bacterium]|nr:VOC family protein [Parvibaculaceae bacterium]